MVSKKFLFFISIILFLLFIYFSYLVAKETFSQIDFDTTVKFQDKISRKWDLPFSLFSLIGLAEITGIFWFILLVVALLKKYWWTFVTSLLLFPLALSMEVFGKLFVHHPGPPYLFYRGVFKFNFPSHYIATDYSYPSGHMLRTTFLISFLMTFSLLKFSFKKQFLIQPILIAFYIIMIISRIYLGEHWVSDVVGGSLVGTSFGILAGITIKLKRLQFLSQNQSF